MLAKPRELRTEARDHLERGSISEFNSQDMQATTVLSNQEIQSSLRQLARNLARLRASGALPRVIASRRRRARRPGWVHDAVVRVLVDQGGPMRVTHVHAAVEALLGESVSADSVSWALASNVRGPAPSFVRVARGQYVLATAELRQTDVRIGGCPSGHGVTYSAVCYSPSGEADVSVGVSSSSASSGAITPTPRGSRASRMRLS